MKNYVVLLLLLLPLSAMATPFSRVVPRIDPLEPIKPVSAAPAPTRTLVVPKAESRSFLPQRVEVLNDDKFVILPKEAPLLSGTVSRDILGDSKNYRVEKPVTVPVAPTIQEPLLKASLIKKDDGRTFVRLEGDSLGHYLPQQQSVKSANHAEKANLEPAVSEEKVAQTSKPKPKPKPKAKAPTPQHMAAKLTYFADSSKPVKKDALNTLLKATKGKTIKRMAITAQSTPLPLQAMEDLPKQRWQYIQQQLESAGHTIKGVRTSEIWLTHADTQFIEIDIWLAQ